MLRSLVNVLMSLTALWAAASIESADAEILTRFYRGTQLQGILFGVGLVKPPSYVFGADLAFPYQRRLGFAREVPFADTFVINRMMGGYREDWLRKFHRWDDRLRRRSLDYVTKSSDGKLEFHPDLIKARLKPYLDAGYRPADITLALDNTPWDLSTPDGRPPQEGVWGRKTPPGDLNEWRTVVSRFASDLKAYLGAGAQEIIFETGLEFDEKASFDGDAEQFYRYYQATDEALHSVLPRARLGPGEFTGGGECTLANLRCVYDTRAFFDFSRRKGLMLDDVPRSLHSLLDVNKAWPSEAAQRLIDSYRRLPPVVEEVHQFGLLYQPFGESAGNDPGPRYASWEFQTLARLISAGPPRRVFHWGGFLPVGKFVFLNGTGFLRLVLDQYVGRDVAAAQTHDQNPDPSFPSETVALALSDKSSVSLIVSSFSPRPALGARTVAVALPVGWMGKRVRLVRYRASDNVFASIRRDLATKDNLRAEFINCPTCLGPPVLMARDADGARKMIGQNWPRYEREMHDGLKWIENDPNVTVEGHTLSARMEANELLVVEPLN